MNSRSFEVTSCDDDGLIAAVAGAYRDRKAEDPREQRAFFVALAVYQNERPDDPNPAAATAMLLRDAKARFGDDLAAL